MEYTYFMGKIIKAINELLSFLIPEKDPKSEDQAVKKRVMSDIAFIIIALLRIALLVGIVIIFSLLAYNIADKISNVI